MLMPLHVSFIQIYSFLSLSIEKKECGVKSEGKLYWLARLRYDFLIDFTNLPRLYLHMKINTYVLKHYQQ